MAMAIKAQGGTGREKDTQTQKEDGKLLVVLNLETSTFLPQLSLFQWKCLAEIPEILSKIFYRHLYISRIWAFAHAMPI